MPRIFEELSTTIPCMKISPRSANQSIIYANVLAYNSQRQFLSTTLLSLLRTGQNVIFSSKSECCYPDLDERQAWRYAAYIYSCTTPNPTDWPEGVDHTADLDIIILESTDLPLSLLVTEENLTRNPGPFFKFLRFALSVIELYNDQNSMLLVNHSQKPRFVGYTTIFNTCEELQRTRKSRRRKLALAICNSVNKNESPRLRDLSEATIAEIQVFISHTRTLIATNNFYPPVETILNTIRSFPLVPRLSFIRSHVMIDTTTLQAILRRSDNREFLMKIAPNHHHNKHDFARVFDLAKIRYRPTDTHRAFTNHLATDGHAASFIFCKGSINSRTATRSRH
ncbi:uncharacterized protein BYT42DRAFT_150395 [Radiomyces spectabilis]|uniref:uncharacterized protein n=1 Tax=Radiomyces spectabilis TaxID=64574 RepID=UPI0022205BAB|nr:uncharacterized protein BYT42DRAFT_150395 [Radiomyces spectabilis]KAI8366018.1 hypothetical protein BYT42DRAFT_150395 [Radiomyces spectabilis]